jgi:hypothetical protein
MVRTSTLMFTLTFALTLMGCPPADFCEYQNDGDCDDGRDGADTDICEYGTDESDCYDVCPYTEDGDCDDGRPGSDTSLCSEGTDIVDCLGV